MKEDFAVDDNGYTKDGYRVLDPVSKRAMYLMSLIQFVILAILVNIARLLLVDWYQGDDKHVNILMYAILAVITLYLFVRPQLYYDHYRYRLDDDKVEVREGIFTITHTLVPVERIHQVEVNKGPIDRHYGLAGVSITTAGGMVSIEYLKEDVAESIASKLNESVVEILRQRD